MSNGVILAKIKNRNLGFILRANVSEGIDPNIAKDIIKEECDTCFAPGVSFETVETYLKCKKEEDYEQLKEYKNRVLQLNNEKTIYDVLDFLGKATNIQILKETSEE